LTTPCTVTYTAGGVEKLLICGTSFRGLSVAGLSHSHIGVLSWFTVYRTASDNLNFIFST